MSSLLTINNLSFAYRAKTVLSEISLEIDPGQFWGIIGPNGAGKSTLLRLLTGYLRPLAGDVLVQDISVYHLTPKKLAQTMAIVRQDLHGDVDLTVEELVLLGRFPHLPPFGRESAHDFAIARERMALTGTLSLADRRVTELSGGERQRAFLAQALAQEPQILLLDEPTSHLDIKHQLMTMELAQQLSREQNLTVIAVLHDLNLAALYCDRLALLADGTLLTSGAVHEVFTRQWLERAYETDVMVTPHPLLGRPQVHLLPHHQVDQVLRRQEA